MQSRKALTTGSADHAQKTTLQPLPPHAAACLRVGQAGGFPSPLRGAGPTPPSASRHTEFAVIVIGPFEYPVCCGRLHQPRTQAVARRSCCARACRPQRSPAIRHGRSCGRAGWATSVTGSLARWQRAYGAVLARSTAKPPLRTAVHALGLAERARALCSGRRPRLEGRSADAGRGTGGGAPGMARPGGRGTRVAGATCSKPFSPSRRHAVAAAGTCSRCRCRRATDPFALTRHTGPVAAPELRLVEPAPAGGHRPFDMGAIRGRHHSCHDALLRGRLSRCRNWWTRCWIGWWKMVW